MDGIVNVRYTVGGLHFDAALDYGRILHSYTYAQRQMFPVELYCLDREEWDIRMLYFEEQVDWDVVVKNTEAWIKEMSE